MLILCILEELFICFKQYASKLVHILSISVGYETELGFYSFN